MLHVHRARLLGYVARWSWRSCWRAPRGAGGLLVPVLVYGACLGTMAVLSTGVNRLTAVGGALFLVSDGLIALDAFVAGFGLPAQGFVVMATYVAAQAPHRRRRPARAAGARHPPPHRRMPSALGERTASGSAFLASRIDQ